MKIIKDSAIYLLGELFAKALPFLLLPYLTRKLGVAGFGELSYWQTIFTLLLIILSLSQDGAVTRYYYVYGKRNLINIVYAGYFYTISLTIIGLVISLLLNSLLLAAVLSAAMTQSLLSTQLSLRQCQKQALSYIIIQIGSGLLITIFTILLLEYTDNYPIEYRFLAIMLGNIIFSVSSLLFFHKNLSYKKINLTLIKKSTGYVFILGLPLIFHQLSYFIKSQIDRFFIYHTYSAEQLGIYAAAFQIASILSIALMAINKATVPYYYQSIKKGFLDKKKIIRYALLSIILVPIPAALSLLIPEYLFTFVLASQYTGVNYYIFMFLFSFGLMIPYYILVNFLFYYGKSKQITTASVLSCLIYIIALIALLPTDIKYIPAATILGNASMIYILASMIRNLKE